MTDKTTAEAAFTIFSTTTCGPCVRLKQRLVDLGIAFDEVNIEHDGTAAAWVMSVNNGDQLVPTLRFSDGSVQANPSVDQVVERLRQLEGRRD